VLTYDLEKTIDFDLSIFTHERQKILLGFKSKKRQFEYYFSRLLWLSFKLDEKIIYLPSGKPTLTDGFISMTHSGNMVAIALSKHQDIGIDLEMISQKIDKVKHKILHPKDAYKNLQELTQLWIVKESVYKLFDGSDVFFMNNVLTKELKHDFAIAYCDIKDYNMQAKVDFYYLQEEYILGVATKQD
jgi:phosphopantetheinyl transferase